MNAAAGASAGASAFALLLICPLLGALIARLRFMPDNAPATINAWLIRVALPCVILEQIPRLDFDARLLLPALGPVVLMGATLVLMAGLARRLHWDRPTQGAMTLCWGLGNASFVGFPLLLAIAGPAALGPAVIADQATFFVVTLVGLPVAAWFAGRSVGAADLALRVLRFTPFQVLLVAGVMRLLGLHWLPLVESVLHRLGDTLTPLALFSVGLQLAPGAMRRALPLVGIGIAWKMIALPLAMWGGAQAFGLHGLPITVGILQVAMAPMITAGILCEDHGLVPDKANAMVSLGIAASFVTVPLLHALIGS